MAPNKTIIVKETLITIIKVNKQEYISLTDMLKAKDGDFFISDWLRNRNTLEFLGIWESIYNPNFNYGEFATIKSQAGLNSFKIRVKDWGRNLNATKQYFFVPSICIYIKLRWCRTLVRYNFIEV